jgi:hypothetical protein
MYIILLYESTIALFLKYVGTDFTAPFLPFSFHWVRIKNGLRFPPKPFLFLQYKERKGIVIHILALTKRGY